MSPPARIKILLLHLETTLWRRARHWSYSAQLGIEEGFRANNVEFFTLTTPWFHRAPQILKGITFDQVWVEIGREEFMNDDWLEWMAGKAPVRVGMMFESLEPSTDEHPPAFRFRKKRVLRRLQYVTHVTASDEVDVHFINSQEKIPAFWWPQAIPSRCVRTAAVSPRIPKAVFCGSFYRDRLPYIENEELKNLILCVPTTEHSSWDPLLFNLLHFPFRGRLKYLVPPHRTLLNGYLSAVRQIRRRCFENWLDFLHSGLAVLNLPHHIRSYPGRVVEGMAVGRPVISWRIPDRPQNSALFEEGKEILLFSEPSELLQHIIRIQRDTEWSRQITSRATLKVNSCHTIEQRVRQVLHWIETGNVPRFG